MPSRVGLSRGPCAAVPLTVVLLLCCLGRACRAAHTGFAGPAPPLATHPRHPGRVPRTIPAGLTHAGEMPDRVTGADQPFCRVPTAHVRGNRPGSERVSKGVIRSDSWRNVSSDQWPGPVTAGCHAPYDRSAMTAAASQSGRRSTSRRLVRAGIRDVAAAAGVSITTVSDALNGKGRLPEETRSRVREVAERLGYRPSAAARTLRTGRSGLIGLTVTTYGEEPFTFTEFAYFAEMARAATSAALGRGFALVVLPASSRHDVWSNIALDGTVVIDPPDQDPLVTELYRSGVPVVSDGKPGNCPVTAWVDNDHEAAVLDILDHLSEAGARRIGLLTGTSTDTYTRL